MMVPGGGGGGIHSNIEYNSKIEHHKCEFLEELY